jgi:hypothetical protein
VPSTTRGRRNRQPLRDCLDGRKLEAVTQQPREHTPNGRDPPASESPTDQLREKRRRESLAEAKLHPECMDVADKWLPIIELTCCIRGITDARPDLVNIDQSARSVSLILTRGDFTPPGWRLDSETFL